MGAAASSAADEPDSSVRSQLRALADTWRALAEVRLGILTVEARRAGTALAATFACAIAAACVLAASWGLLVAGVAWWAIDRGTDPAVAIGVVLLVNLAVALLLLYGARAFALRIAFPHTRQSLKAPGAQP